MPAPTELPTAILLYKAIRNVGDEVSRIRKGQEKADGDIGSIAAELSSLSHRHEITEKTVAATHAMMTAMSLQQQLPTVPVPSIPQRSISPGPMRLKLDSSQAFDAELEQAQVRRVGRTVIDARGKLMWAAILAFVGTVSAAFGGYAVSEAKHQSAPLVAPISHP
jgi:hypothetical protein